MNSIDKPNTAAREDHEKFADPVARADHRRESQDQHDVTIDNDGAVKQKPHGSMDASAVPRGKEHPEQGPYEPGHDQLDPALQPDPQAPEVPQPPPGATRRT
jgi:hypothetical protein